MTSRPTLISAALLVAALFPAPAFAQRHAAPAPGHPSRIGPGMTGRGQTTHRGRHGVFIYPYYWDDYGADTSGEPEQPTVPPVTVSVQQPQAPAPPPKPANSLLLEYREGQWIRIPTGSQMPIGPQNAQLQESAPPSKNAAANSRLTPSRASAKLPPALLVFKDGHQEQVARYVVQGNVIYTGSDYWSTGAWTRKIPISDLDVPASLKANAERGTNFTLPTRPDEVVVRF